jgi:hypothetical protein
MSFVTTMHLRYPDHSEEIESLNRVLHELERAKPLPPELVRTVEFILARLDHLMLAPRAKLSVYDQRVT